MQLEPAVRLPKRKCILSRPLPLHQCITHDLPSSNNALQSRPQPHPRLRRMPFHKPSSARQEAHQVSRLISTHHHCPRPANRNKRLVPLNQHLLSASRYAIRTRHVPRAFPAGRVHRDQRPFRRRARLLARHRPSRHLARPAQSETPFGVFAPEIYLFLLDW